MKNVILTGFMGTGKTSTGKLLAAKLGLAFLDLDRYIEEMTGKSVPAIFAEEGEARFRELEKRAVKEVSQKKNHVIATGGGAVIDEENRRLLSASGVIVCLTASTDAILFRTAACGERPLLDGTEERREKIDELLKSRRKAYESADFTLDTSELSPMGASEEIARYLRNC